MNYLAHAYLSFNHPQILLGNMISDFVKGKSQYDYESLVHKGIILHRSIDGFTDDHPATKEMKKIFKPAYGLYAGAFADIVYDYFLANDKNEFPSSTDLEKFAFNTYEMLEENLEATPPVFQQMFPYMKMHNWLANYRHKGGIEKSFAGMVRRAKYMNESDSAFRIFENNIPALKPYYDEFFPLLKKHSFNTFRELIIID